MGRVAAPCAARRWIIVDLERDVTQRKNAEDALHESEANYRNLIEQAADGIFLCNSQGNFVLVNSSGCELLGYPEGKLIGMNGSLTFPEEGCEIQAMRAERAGG